VKNTTAVAIVTVDNACSLCRSSQLQKDCNMFMSIEVRFPIAGDGSVCYESQKVPRQHVRAVP
jgi:hypothetical protein